MANANDGSPGAANVATDEPIDGIRESNANADDEFVELIAVIVNVVVDDGLNAIVRCEK